MYNSKLEIRTEEKKIKIYTYKIIRNKIFLKINV